jgi:hypothetical protein
VLQLQPTQPTQLELHWSAPSPAARMLHNVVVSSPMAPARPLRRWPSSFRPAAARPASQARRAAPSRRSEQALEVSRGEQMLITQTLRGCRTWRELCSVVTAEEPRLNTIHLAAFLTRLQQLYPHKLPKPVAASPRCARARRAPAPLPRARPAPPSAAPGQPLAAVALALSQPPPQPPADLDTTAPAARPPPERSPLPPPPPVPPT